MSTKVESAVTSSQEIGETVGLRVGVADGARVGGRLQPKQVKRHCYAIASSYSRPGTPLTIEHSPRNSAWAQ